MATDDSCTGPINLGNPKEFTIKELAEHVLKLTTSTSKLETNPLPKDDPRQRQPNITKAKDLLGWEPTIQLEQGLINTIDYFRKIL
jgi:UDP-glucuronate decarboxylase